MKTLILPAILVLSAQAHAMYHGHSECVYKDKNVKIEMTERSNAEGLGFDGFRITELKTKKSLTYEYTSVGSFGDLSAKDVIVVREKSDEGDVAKFTVVSVKLVHDNSKSESCSIEDDRATTVLMTTDLKGFKGRVLQFACLNEGFNPRMSPSCDEE